MLILLSYHQELLKNYFKKSAQSITNKRVQKFCEIYPEISQILDKILKETPQWLSKRNYIFAFLNHIELIKCKECRKIT